MQLDSLGQEYGDCRKEQVTGDVSLLEISYSMDGVSQVKFADSTKIFSLGREEADSLSQKHVFGENEKWVGLHGA